MRVIDFLSSPDEIGNRSRTTRVVPMTNLIGFNLDLSICLEQSTPTFNPTIESLLAAYMYTCQSFSGGDDIPRKESALKRLEDNPCMY